MHQDQRIGLALGVLLIGACAAFFFRNETRERTHTPRLQHAQELDDRIAERATHPYLKGIEAVEAGDRGRLRTVADHGSDADGSDADHGLPSWNSAELSGVRKSRNQSNSQSRPRASITDLDSDVQELDPIPVPTDKSYLASKTHDKETIDARNGAGRKGLKLEATPSGGRTHVVQKGDTLSSIAAKSLGSAHRFHEIFEANQDQLKDANDLRSGMVLHIPDSRSELPVKTLAGKARSAADTETSILQESVSTIDPQKDTVSPSAERHTPAPRTEVDEHPAPQVNHELPTESPTDSEPARKFVPARRFTPGTRP